MPIGLYLMVGFSLIVFRRARSVGRRPWLWVLIMWLLALGVSFVASLIGAAFAILSGTGKPTERELL